MSLYENQFEHAKSIDDRLIQLEQKEQEERKSNRPWQRFFGILSTCASLGFSIYSLNKALEFHINGVTSYIVGLVISIALGIVAVNLLGIKNKGKKTI